MRGSSTSPCENSKFNPGDNFFSRPYSLTFSFYLFYVFCEKKIKRRCLGEIMESSSRVIGDLYGEQRNVLI